MNSIHILFRSFSLFFLQNRRSSRRRRYQSRFGARAPHALPSLFLSLTSQHEIYSLKSLNYILVTNFFMPLRETKDSAEYYEAVLSLKSTGLLTYRTKRFRLLCSVCERDIVENALEKKSRSSHSRALSYSSRFLSSSSAILSEPQREMIPLRVVVFRGCIHMCLHVFDFLFFF